MAAEQKKTTRCANRNLRMGSRVLTSYFDKAFKPIGLHSPQFTMLLEISSHEDITVSELALVGAMDQTTVTRNVEILKKKGYVNVKTDSEDSRKKCISLSCSGREKLDQALPLWRKAQDHIEQNVGKEKYDVFLETLHEIMDTI